MQSQMHLWTLHPGHPQLHPLLVIPSAAEMVTPPFTTEGTAAPPSHMDLYQRGPYYTEQTVHTITSKIETYNETAVNFGSMKSTKRIQPPPKT